MRFLHSSYKRKSDCVAKTSRYNKLKWRLWGLVMVSSLGALSWKGWETQACLRGKTPILKFWHRQICWMIHYWGSEEFRSAFAFFKSSICCELKKSPHLTMDWSLSLERPSNISVIDQRLTFHHSYRSLRDNAN